MRVLFSSTRGTGHWLPLLPYARAMRERGCEVVVAAPAEVAEAVRQEGLAYFPFDHPGDSALSPIWARIQAASREEGTDLALSEIFAGLNAKVALPKLRETIRTWKPDLIVRESAEFAAAVAADCAELPHLRVAVHLVSFEDRFRGLVAEPIDALRCQAGLPPDGAAFLDAEPTFTAFPRSMDVVPGQPERISIPFRVRLREDQAGSAPAAWFPTGSEQPMVYITFGTLAGGSPHVRSVYRMALDAVANLPVHALLTTGRGMEAGTLGPIPGNVHVEEWIAQGDVLMRASALVCHGGSGTIRGALAAGVPMVVVPLFADQPHNARRVAATGAGLALFEADAAALRAALQRLLSEDGFRDGARTIAHEIAALPSVDDAVTAMLATASR